MARARDQPNVLLVGDSTRYWCHVMERKLFSDPAIVKTLNDQAVSIKVDRGEKSDVDRIYVQAVRMMRQGGGRPMSLFLTPDRRPFSGATCIPPENRGQQPAFPGVVRQTSDARTGQRNEIQT